MGKYGRQYIGKLFNNGNLKIIDGGDKKGFVKVSCCVCAQDSELFGFALYHVQINTLIKGHVPCGCSKTFRYSLPQYEVRILRKIKDEQLPIRFIRFIQNGSNKLSRSGVELECITTGIKYSVSSITNFLLGAGITGKYGLDAQIKKYNQKSTAVTVWDTGAKEGTKSIIGYHCSICEENGFESLFTTLGWRLFIKGCVPCYCGRCPVKDNEYHLTNNVKDILQESGIQDVSVLGVIRKGKKDAPYAVFMCREHGLYSRVYNDIKTVGCHCPKCNPPKCGYNKALTGYLYILQIQSQNSSSIGYGITSQLERRTNSHKRNLKSIGATITNIQVFEGSGSAVLSVENAIKSLHTTGLLDCEGFRRESISIDRKEEVLELCKKLKELDNADKLL